MARLLEELAAAQPMEMLMGAQAEAE
jgi:hypothetical protein